MHLLVVEDNAKVASSVTQGLRENGYEVSVARTAPDALEAIRHTAFDLVILDLGLPGGDGIDVLNTMRGEGHSVPVLILTARDTVDDRVRGLDAGGDDYIVKPFAFSELQARVRAHLRRSRRDRGTVLKVADLEVDLTKRGVVRAGQDIQLTPREFDLLAYFMSAEGNMVSREMLARDVWKEESRATPLDNVIDVHISHLRDKIDKPFDTKLIHTVRGVGYVLREKS